MGVFDFIKDAGSRILRGNMDEKFEAAREEAEEAKAAETEADSAAAKAREAARDAAVRARAASRKAAAAAKEKAGEAREVASTKRAEARAAFEERRAESRKANELEDYVKELGLGDDIDVRFDDGTAYVSGTVEDQATLERVVLALGNVEGVERVDEDLDVEAAEETAAQMYTVKSGDTLSAIAQQFYGDANRYPEIFEANQPMLLDPDKIYPGQVLRIP